MYLGKKRGRTPKFRLTVECARTNSRKEAVWTRTTRTPANRENSAHVRGYTDRFRVFSATGSEKFRRITTPKEVTKARLLGHRRRSHRYPGARPGPRDIPGRSRTSATSHDRAAAKTQHHKSCANSDSSNPRLCEPVLTILGQTTTLESNPDHQEEPRSPARPQEQPRQASYQRHET